MEENNNMSADPCVPIISQVQRMVEDSHVTPWPEASSTNQSVMAMCLEDIADHPSNSYSCLRTSTIGLNSGSGSFSKPFYPGRLSWTLKATG